MHFLTKQATAGPELGATAPGGDSRAVVLQGLLRSPHAAWIRESYFCYPGRTGASTLLNWAP